MSYQEVATEIRTQIGGQALMLLGAQHQACDDIQHVGLLQKCAG